MSFKISFVTIFFVKRILATLFIFLFLNVGNLLAASFNWKSVGLNDADTEWYYDRKTVFEVDNYRYYWILANYLKDIEDDVFSVIGHHMVNCKTQESRWITYTSYNRPMGRGEVLDSWVIPEIDINYFKWEYFDENNTIYGKLMREVCEE